MAKKEQYGRGFVWYVPNQRELTDAEKRELLEKLEGATSVHYSGGDSLFTNVHNLNVGSIWPNREILAAVEQLLHENGWELKWTRKRKPRQKKEAATYRPLDETPTPEEGGDGVFFKRLAERE